MLTIGKIDLAAQTAGFKYISVIGAGGKSSLINYLADSAVRAGKKTIITTTTRIWAHEPYALLDQNKDFDDPPPNPLHVGKSLDGHKLTSVGFNDIQEMGKNFDTILIEADGAKMKPLKFPNDTEPVIPPFTNLILVVAGLDGLLGKVEEKIFRWELLQAKQGIKPAETINDDLFLNLFSPDALLKGTANIPAWILLNKYDQMKGQKNPTKLAAKILERTKAEKVIISSLPHKIFYAMSRE